MIKEAQPIEITEEILCKQSEVPEIPKETGKFNPPSSVKDKPSPFSRHRNCVSAPPMLSDKGEPISLISNAPTLPDYGGGMPDDPLVLEIFALRRKNKALADDLRHQHLKMTRALNQLYDQRRFFRLGLFENQWESFDQLKTRLTHLEGTIQFLDDPIAGHHSEMEIPERWKKTTKTKSG